MAILASLVSVALVSLISLVGLLFVGGHRARRPKLTRLFVSFAVGALLGDVFIHLVPELFGESARGSAHVARSFLVLASIVLFFAIEKLIRHQRSSGAQAVRSELLAINLLGDAIHNFIDGVIIGASYLASPTLGVSTTLAVVLHEIPQELGDFGILMHAGLGVRKAALLNLASAGTAILGTGAALVLGTALREVVSDVLLPIAAGGFVYLASADLIPELQKDCSLRALLSQTTAIAAGIGVMGMLLAFET